MRPILGTILTLALASGASVALAQNYQPPPTYQQWGDDREGGHRYAYGDPNSPEGYVEEEYYRRALPPAPPPPGLPPVTGGPPAPPPPGLPPVTGGPPPPRQSRTPGLRGPG